VQSQPIPIHIDNAEMETAVMAGINRWVKVSAARRKLLSVPDRDALFDHIVAALRTANDKATRK
jgi:hypothetical protein